MSPAQQSLADQLIHNKTCPLPPPLPLKVFKPKILGLPVVTDYKLDPGPLFWKIFPFNFKKEGGSPYKIDHEKLRELMLRTGIPEMKMVEAIIHDIINGCDMGVGEEYIGTRSRNADNAYTNGERVTDAIGHWINQKIVAGISVGVSHTRSRSQRWEWNWAPPASISMEPARESEADANNIPSTREVDIAVYFNQLSACRLRCPPFDGSVRVNPNILYLRVIPIQGF